MHEEPDDHDSDSAERARLDRLAAGLHQVAVERGRRLDHRLLAVLAGVLVPVGIILVLIGWHGASRTPNVYEQVPYLISGAELGQTLALLGALFYFAYWLTALVEEHRAQGSAIVDALARVEEAISALAVAGGSAASGAPPTLVTTARGRLAHRPDCAAVAGRAQLRPVGPDEAMARCRLCLDEG